MDEDVPFKSFTDMLFEVRHMPTNVAKTKALRRFFETAGISRPQDAENAVQILRCADYEDLNKFRSGVILLRNRVAKALGLEIKEVTITDSGDIYRSLRELIKPIAERFFSPSRIKLGEANRMLKRLMEGDGIERTEILREFFDKCSSDELLWIFAVITKSMVSALNWDIKFLREAISASGHDEFKKNRDTIKDVEKRENYPLMYNFEPMLLARLDLNDWYKRIKDHSGPEFFIELKYDGEHVLIHKKSEGKPAQTIWRVVTRNGKDFTKYYDGTTGGKNLLKDFGAAIRPNIVDFVLDCELMLYDEISRKIVRHHQPCSDGKVYNFQNIEPSAPVHLIIVIVDVLYLNGRSLLDTPYEERAKAPKFILQNEDPTTFFCIEQEIGSTREDVQRFFQKAMTEGQEGIVIKRRDTIYRPGSRAMKNGWFKVKPNLTEGSHMDVAIVGVKYVGTDREQHFVIAVKKVSYFEEQENELDFTLKVIGSVSAGLKRTERSWILDGATSMGKLLPEPPTGVIGQEILDGGYFRDWDDFKVVEVQCMGKQEGALQHASMVRLREDKDIKDCDTYHDFKNLDEKIRSGVLPDLDATMQGSQTKDPKRKVQPKISKRSLLAVEAKRAKVKRVNDVLDGIIIQMIPGKNDIRLKKLAEILQGFGAKILATQSPNINFLIAESKDARQTKKKIREEKFTVIDGVWVERCKNMDRVVEWLPEEILSRPSNSFLLELKD